MGRGIGRPLASIKEVLAHLAAVGTPPDRETAVRISVGLEGILARFDSEIFPFLVSGGSEIKFVFGANGRGKTHFLLAVQDLARKYGFVTARIECQMGQSPFAHLRETYRMIAESLSPLERSTSLGAPAEGVASVIAHRFSEASASEVSEIVKNLKASKHLAPDFRNLVIAYGQGIADKSLNAFSQPALEALLSASSTYRVAVGELYRRDKGLPKPLGKLGTRNAGLWVRSLLSLPRALGYPGVVVMFDETERAFHGASYGQDLQQLANLRNLVDYCALGTLSGSMILYSASEDFLDFARERLDALAQRIEPASLQQGVKGRNQRAIWADLDDLTEPNATESRFFHLLAKKMVGLGVGLRLPPDKVIRASRRIFSLADSAGKSLEQGNVRNFVKAAAATLLLETGTRG